MSGTIGKQNKYKGKGMGSGHMQLWMDKNNPTEYVIYDLHKVLTRTQLVDIVEFELQQQKAQIKYQTIHQQLEGSELGFYGVAIDDTYISDSWGQLMVVQTEGAVSERVQQVIDGVNAKYSIQKLTQVMLDESLDTIQHYLPEEYHQQTYKTLHSISYVNDIQLVVDTLTVLNQWLEGDGITGKCIYTEDGLEVHFELEHPIIIHLGGYGKHRKGVDRTFLLVINPYDTLDNKVTSLLTTFLEYYNWLNPSDLSYQTNRVLGDERILVTLKDTRILEYQDHVKAEFKKVERHALVSNTQLTFSHTTRSVYADIHLKRGLGILRVSVRDHQKSYEEDTIKIIVKTLKAKNIAERVLQEVEKYIGGRDS